MENKKFQYVISEIKKQKKKMKRLFKTGFLLIEIMAALILFAGIALLLARYQVSIVQATKEAQNYLQAMSIGCEAFDPSLQIAFGNSLRASGGIANTQESSLIRVERMVQDFVIPAALKDQLNRLGLMSERLKKIKQVRVDVSWTAMDGYKRRIHLESVVALNEQGRGDA